MAFRPALIILASLAMGASGATALELEDVTYDTDGGGKVVFSHKTHLKKKVEKGPNVSCRTCHDTPRAARTKATMADMERGRSCGKCHNGRKAFGITRCDGCHAVKDIVYRIKATGPVQFSHARHLEKMQCRACHNALYATGRNRQVTMAQMEKGKSCGACHDAKRAFSVSRCDKCHPVRELRFKVAGISDATFSHKAHLGMFRCTDCHTGTFPTRRTQRRVTMEEMANAKSCGACHDGKSAFSVTGNCDSCHMKG